MQSKAEAGQTLQRLIQDVRIPSALTFDCAQEQVGSKTEFQKTIIKYHIKQH